MVVAMGHTDDDYGVWTHRDAAHAHTGSRSVVVISSYTTLTLGLASDHAFWSYSKRQPCQGARTTLRLRRGVGPGGLVLY